MYKENDLTIGVDIGGSHITAGIVDMRRKIVHSHSVCRNEVNRNGSADEILNVWAETIRQAIGLVENSFAGIGFAMPGPFDYEEGICLIKGFDKYEALYGMSVRFELAKRLRVPPQDIVFRNDAEAFLEGELFCGAARDYKHAIGLTLGTGLGSAISHNGVTHDAELSVLDYQGEKIEEWVSTRGLIRIYKELTGVPIHDALAIAEYYHTKDEARQTFKIFAGHLSWFLQRFIEKEEPEVVVIGGNIAKSFNLFIDDVTNNLVEAKVSLPKIVQATLGENALLIGGACKCLTTAKIDY